MALTREQILAADDLEIVELEVPEWGGTVRLRELDAYTAQKLFKELEGADEMQVQVLMCAACIVGDDDQALFTAEDVAALQKKSALVISRIAAEAMKLSRGRREDAEAYRANFPATQGADLRSN